MPSDAKQLAIYSSVKLGCSDLSRLVLTFTEGSANNGQVTYQLKILTSAIFSVTMLRKNITTRQWLALFLLTFGIALVQIPSSSINAFNVSNVHSTILTPMSYQAQYGLTAVILACLLSGLAGVYFEKVLKASETTLWVRNVQLSFFSLFPALILGVIWKDGTEIWDKVTPDQNYLSQLFLGVFLRLQQLCHFGNYVSGFWGDHCSSLCGIR